MRRRYIQEKVTGKLIEVPQGYRPPPRKTPYIRGDIEPFVSSVDGSIINSSSDLRAHNARHGVVNTAEYGEGNTCDPSALKERIQKIEGTHKETNAARLKDVVAAYKKVTGDL